MTVSMDTFSDVINRWPSLNEFASDIGVEYVTAQVMRWRNSINSRHWSAVVAAAASRGFDGITLEALASIKAGREGKGRRRRLLERAA